MVGRRREQPGRGDQSREGLRERDHRSQEKSVFQRKERAAGLTVAKRTGPLRQEKCVVRGKNELIRRRRISVRG